MTTATWTTGLSAADTAGWQAFLTEFETKMTAVGMVQTGDTGQIAGSSVTYPGTNTTAGYQIWYLNDSMHATQGIYIKFTFAQGSTTARLNLTFQVGEGSDGSGNLTGQTSDSKTWTYGSGNIGASTYPSYAVMVTGLFGLVWKVGCSAAGYAFGAIIVARPSDSSGAPTAEGCMILCQSNTSSAASSVMGMQTVRFDATATTFAFGGQGTADGNNYFNLPGSDTTTDVSGDTQAVVAWGPLPTFRPFIGLGCCLINELSAGSTASITFVGSTAHTYINMGIYLGRLGARTSSSDDQGVGLLMQWE